MTTAPQRRGNAARRSAATVENGAQEEAHRRHHAADVRCHAIVLHPSQAINPRRSLHAASKRRRSLLRPPRPRTKTAYQQALQTTGRRIQMIWGRSTDAEDAGEQRVLENRGCEQWGACPSHIRSRPKPPKWRRNGDRTTSEGVERGKNGEQVDEGQQDGRSGRDAVQKRGTQKRIHVICWETINDAEPRTRERVC